MYSEIRVPKGGEVLYTPRGDFTYSIVDAVSHAYAKALKTNSLPIVACLQDKEYIGRGNIPLSKIGFIGIEKRKGLEYLVDFYERNIDQIPEIDKRMGRGEEVLAYLYQQGLIPYINQKNALLH